MNTHCWCEAQHLSCEISMNHRFPVLICKNIPWFHTDDTFWPDLIPSNSSAISKSSCRSQPEFPKNGRPDPMRSSYELWASGTISSIAQMPMVGGACYTMFRVTAWQPNGTNNLAFNDWVIFVIHVSLKTEDTLRPTWNCDNTWQLSIKNNRMFINLSLMSKNHWRKLGYPSTCWVEAFLLDVLSLQHSKYGYQEFAIYPQIIWHTTKKDTQVWFSSF